MNIRKMKYRGDALKWSADVAVDGDLVSVEEFIIEVQGTPYTMSAEAFTLEDGDKIYMTPDGLELEKSPGEGEDPAERTPFPETGASYWLAARSGQTIMILEAEK